MLIARLIADPDETYNHSDELDNDIEENGIGGGLVRLESFDGFEQFEVDGDNIAGLCKLLDAHFPSTDMLVARDEVRVPQVFVSDMDSTMIGQECIDELADYAGLKAQIAAITERAMQGELDFESALRERVALLDGLDSAIPAKCLRERISLSPGAATLVATLKAHGCRSVLVTGGFHQFADPIAEQLGFDRVVGNRLSMTQGKIDGKLFGPIVDSSTKRQILIEEIAKLGNGAISLATGDGANDIPMIEAATYGFAYRAKPKTREAANGWVDRGDLTSVLSLLGIPKTDWVGGNTEATA